MKKILAAVTLAVATLTPSAASAEEFAPEPVLCSLTTTSWYTDRPNEYGWLIVHQDGAQVESWRTWRNVSRAKVGVVRYTERRGMVCVEKF